MLRIETASGHQPAPCPSSASESVSNKVRSDLVASDLAGLGPAVPAFEAGGLGIRAIGAGLFL